MTTEVIFFFTRVESKIPHRRASKNRLIEWCLLLGNLYFCKRTWLDYETFKWLNILIVAVRKQGHSGSWGFSLLFLTHTKPERGCYYTAKAFLQKKLEKVKYFEADFNNVNKLLISYLYMTGDPVCCYYCNWKAKMYSFDEWSSLSDSCFLAECCCQ